MNDAKYFCNPIDLPYRVQHAMIGDREFVFRELADPSIVEFRGTYYLFASMTGGFFSSQDLVSWDFTATPTLPFWEYAPDIRVIGDRLVYCGSRSDSICDFYVTDDPFSGEWRRVAGQEAMFDPNLFEDEDGRVYLYEGCSSTVPLRGVELDPTTLQRIGTPVDVLFIAPADRGWERIPHDDPPASEAAAQLYHESFAEAPWMTKREGVYYLQYASSATIFKNYADGYFTASSPLGPFEYSIASPFSAKPGGFIRGAGHGSLLQDAYGNWWHAATSRVSVNHMFERRIGLYPAGFDDAGTLFCNQEFADYPVVVPTSEEDPWGLTGRLMLQVPVALRSSSSHPDHPSTLAVDENVRTHWQAQTSKTDEWLELEFPVGTTISAIQVNLTDAEPTAPPSAPEDWHFDGHDQRTFWAEDFATPLTAAVSEDGEHWTDWAGAKASVNVHHFRSSTEPVPVRFLRITAERTPLGGPLAVTGVRAFGHGVGPVPEQVRHSTRRVDGITALVSWLSVEGARGYNVRFGLAPDKLYHCTQVVESANSQRIDLNRGVDYWVAVDSFNENGFTRGVASRIPHVHEGKSRPVHGELTQAK